VANAFGVTEFDRLADVEGQTGGRDQTGSQFARMKRDVDSRVNAVQVIEHLHLQVIVAHRDFAVLRHDEVDPDNVGVCRCNLEAK
jgi:hypothetical protein